MKSRAVTSHVRN